MLGSRAIIQAIADGRLGGGTTHVLHILRGLKDSYQFHLVTQPNSYLAGVARSLGVNVFEIDFFSPPWMVIRRLRRVLNEAKANLVHAHGSRAGFYVALTAQLDIYTLHGFHSMNRSGIWRFVGGWAERFTMSRARQIVFVSQYDQALAMRLKIISNSKQSRVIYNGVVPELHPRHSSTEKLWDIGFVGRLEYPKDPFLFLKVLKKVNFQKAVIIGGGSLEKEVKRLCTAMGLANRVDFIGPLPHEEVLSYLAKIKLVLMTSRWEGLPILPLEAIAAGVPVVAPSVGGIPEILADGSGGLVVPRNVESLAEAVNTLLSNHELRLQLIAKGQRRLRETFSIQKMLSNLKALYDEMLASVNGGTSSIH